MGNVCKGGGMTTEQVLQELRDAFAQLAESRGDERAVNRFVARLAILMAKLEQEVGQ